MDPTYGEILAGQLHYFCVKEISKKAKGAVLNREELDRHIDNCFGNLAKAQCEMVRVFE